MHVKYCFYLVLTQRKSAKRVPEKQLKSGQKKKQDRNSSFSFDAFIVFIYLSGVSKLKLTEGKVLSNKITNIDY